MVGLDESTAKKELEKLGKKLLISEKKEKKRIKQRLIWLANISINPKTKKMYREAYLSIKIR